MVTSGNRGPLRSGRSPGPAARAGLCVVAALLAMSSMGLGGTRAAELIMFESAVCEWCDAWDREIGFFYHKTSEGRRAPLRRIDIQDRRPGELKEIQGIVYTPTFVLVEDGWELGRITGYPGEDHFWGLLGELVERLPKSAARTETCGGEIATKGETSSC